MSSAANMMGPSESADEDLPSVMTCANYLKLPPYSTKVMKINCICLHAFSKIELFHPSFSFRKLCIRNYFMPSAKDKDLSICRSLHHNLLLICCWLVSTLEAEAPFLFFQEKEKAESHTPSSDGNLQMVSPVPNGVNFQFILHLFLRNDTFNDTNPAYPLVLNVTAAPIVSFCLNYFC